MVEICQIYGINRCINIIPVKIIVIELEGPHQVLQNERIESETQRTKVRFEALLLSATWVIPIQSFS